MSVSATVVIEFGAGADSSALVKVELDDQENLDSSGNTKTSFYHDDVPEFLVHFDGAALRFDRASCSSGMVVSQDVVSREKSQQMSWQDSENSQELPYIPDGGLNWDWDGNNGGVVQNGRTLIAAGDVPAIGMVSYLIKANSFRFIPPALDLEVDETYNVLVVIHMAAAQ